MKKTPKKLVLARETLKQLTATEEDLKDARGATLATVCLTEFCNTGSLCYC